MVAIDMSAYEAVYSEVFAGKITEDNIGEIIQELYDNGANHILLESHQTSKGVVTNLIVVIRGTHYSVTIDDYLVEEDGEFGVVLFPMKAASFEKDYVLTEKF